MKSLLLFLAIASWSGAAYSQVPVAQAEEAARRALQLLEIGEKSAAIEEILEVLPADPDDATLGRYPDAMEALWRSVSSRVVRLDFDGHVTASVSPNGERMITASIERGRASLPISLHDARTGEVISVIASGDEVTRGGGIPSDTSVRFSPDGTRIAVALVDLDLLIVADGVTGERLVDIDFSDHALSLGFSDDSRLIAATGPLGLTMWAAETGETVFHRPYALPSRTGPFTLRRGFGWLSDTTLLETVVQAQGPQEIYSQRVEELLEIGPGTERVIATDIDLDLTSFARKAGRDEFVMTSAKGAIVVDRDEGVTTRMPGSQAPVVLSRGGEALVWPLNFDDGGIAEQRVLVRDLAGNELDPEPRDYGFLSGIVVAESGGLLGRTTSVDRVSVSYRGGDLPLGLELYRLAAAAIGFEGRGTGPRSASEGTLPAEELSRQFARDAVDHLARGERREAMIAALRGLPANPTEDDMRLFGDAHDALYRASAARPVVVERQDEAVYVVGQAGRRGVLLQPRENWSMADAFLVDAEAGRILTRLSHPDMPDTWFGPASPIFYSPDGSTFILAPESNDRISVFRAEDGALVRDIMIPGAKAYQRRRVSLFIGGFSRDGSQIAVSDSGDVLVFSTENGQPLYQISLPDGIRNGMALGWGQSGRLYVDGLRDPAMQMPGPPGRPGIPPRPTAAPGGDDGGLKQVVAAYIDGRMVSEIEVPQDLSRDGRAEIRLSPATANMLVRAGNLGVLSPDGDHLFTIPGRRIGLWVREGTAVASIASSGSGETGIEVYDLSGTEIPVEPADHVQFDSGAFDQTGSSLNYMETHRIQYWTGGETPTGLALYEETWSSFEPAERDEVEAARIARP